MDCDADLQCGAEDKGVVLWINGGFVCNADLHCEAMIKSVVCGLTLFFPKSQTYALRRTKGAACYFCDQK